MNAAVRRAARPVKASWPDTTVVLYGYAPAMGLWLMKLYGHQDVRILDCSRDTWHAEKRPAVQQYARPASRHQLSACVGRISGYAPATPPAGAAAIGAPGTTILDVRSLEEYRGERFWPSGGMEPGGRAGARPLGGPPAHRRPLRRPRVLPDRRRAAGHALRR